MTKEEFLTEARQILTPNPYDRLGIEAKEVLANNNFIIDAHAHIFDGDCVDEGYFILRMIAGLGKRLKRKVFFFLKPNYISTSNLKSDSFDIYEALAEMSTMENTKSFHSDFLSDFESKIERELHNEENEEDAQNKSLTSDFDFRRALKRIREVIGILKTRRMASVLDTFENCYSISNKDNTGREQLTVILGMDLNKGWDRPGTRIQKSQRDQNNELMELTKTRAILPFFPVDPRRADDSDKEENLYHNFLHAFKNNGTCFYGVKVYPALGYSPNDPALDPIFEICAEMNIPVLTHCGGNVVSSFQENIYINDGGNRVKVPGDTRTKRATYLNKPQRWAAVLAKQKNKNLRINFGHFAGSGRWKKYGTSNKHISKLISYMNEYPNVYSDFSFNLSSDKATKRFVKALKNDEMLQKRTLHGTDFWVVLPSSNLLDDQRKMANKLGVYFEDTAVANPLAYLGLEGTMA